MNIKFNLTLTSLFTYFSFLILLSCSESDNKSSSFIALNKKEISINVGESFQLEAFFSDETENEAHTWESENPEIANVDFTGKVTGIAPGGTKIIATALENGSKAKCKVTVNKVPAKSPENLKIGDEISKSLMGLNHFKEITINSDRNAIITDGPGSYISQYPSTYTYQKTGEKTANFKAT